MILFSTGASSGIGAETAVYMGKLGCRLLITGRNKDNLEATRKRCLEAGVLESNVCIMFILFTQ
jgi:NADP-dependent 3-hydroxy acid dehydrogenase YdfG